MGPLRRFIIFWGLAAQMPSAMDQDRMSALRAVTIDAAWQVFMDDDIGSIEPGKLADLVVLSGSPLTAPDLRELLVDMTLIEGVTHFQRAVD